MPSHHRHEMFSGTIDLIPSGRFERRKPSGQFAPGWLGCDGRSGLAAATLLTSAICPAREVPVEDPLIRVRVRLPSSPGIVFRVG